MSKRGTETQFLSPLSPFAPVECVVDPGGCGIRPAFFLRSLAPAQTPSLAALVAPADDPAIGV